MEPVQWQPSTSKRFFRLWSRGRDWNLTAAVALVCFILSLLLVRVDQHLDLSISTRRLWLYAGDPGSANTLLSAIAASTITVAGVIFSANLVAMQLASSSYTPRIIHTLIRKKRLQFALGIFIGTFIYCVMVLRVTSSATVGQPAFVPVVSITVGIILGIVSTATLVFFIHYGTLSMQPAFLIGSAAEDALKLISTGAPPESSPRWHFPGPVDEPSTAITSPIWGYIQSLDSGVLGAFAERRNLVIRLEVYIGDAVLPGEKLLTVWPGDAADQETIEVLRRTFTIGNERTPEQDIEYGFQRVQDIALMALSPAVNDPTSARWCIDRLGQMLITLALDPVDPYRVEKAPGQDRILWDSRLFERCFDISFTQIRHYGFTDPIVVEHLLRTMRRIASLAPEKYFASVAIEAQLLATQALTHLDLDADRDRIRSASTWANIELPHTDPLDQPNPLNV